MDKRLISPEKMQELLDQVQDMDIPDLEKKSQQEVLEILLTLAMKSAAEAQLAKCQSRPQPEGVREQIAEMFKRDRFHQYPNDANEFADSILKPVAPEAVRAEERRKIGEWLVNLIDIDQLAKLNPRPNVLELANGLVALEAGNPVTALKSGQAIEEGG